MKKAIWLSLLLCYTLWASSQDTISIKNLDEVLIYSNKFIERKKNIAQKIDVISAQRIAQINAQNIGDLLINTGNVFVQKSQQGGSSPVIRGFEASRVLLVVDGIRMNNAIYRAGHLQNVITVDQNMLERVEVLYGPTSTVYGSDALGGVVHLMTKPPKLSLNNKIFTTGSTFIRYSSANEEKTGHVDLSLGWKTFAWLQSYNYSEFGDMKMGTKYPDKYPNFGRRSEYITNINGIDSVVTNEDDNVQKFSGYKQWDITQKLLFQPGKKTTHSLNLQYSNSTDVPRYDRLQDIRNGTLRFAEWYYGPQKRELAAYELNISKPGWLDNFKTIASYQHIDESRHQREYRRYDRLENRLEDLDVFALMIDARKLWGSNELTFGADGQYNDLTSNAFREDTRTGVAVKLDSRYPNGVNKASYYGVYAQHLLKFGKGKFVLNDGIRLQSVNIHSRIADNSFFNLPFTKIDQNNFAVTGNLGLIYMAPADFRATLGLSSGFRAPNIDDLSRIFESNTASRQLIISNPDIKPEYTYNVDLGLSKTFAGTILFEVTGFYTRFRNAIALSPFQLNGQDSVLYNGNKSKVYANQNVNQAHLYGFNASLTIDIIKQLKLNSTINYTYGRLKPNKAPDVPLDHIPPVFGKTGISYAVNKINAEAYASYNGWKRLKDYNQSGEDNAQYATPDGTPSWITFNFKSSISLHKNFYIQLGVENILDRNYRYFASGFSAPGRNFILAIRTNF